MKTMEPDRKEEFWKKAEERHGTVLGYGMGQYSSTETDKLQIPQISKKRERIWGLIYTSSKGLFLYRFPQQSFFSSLFQQAPQKEMWIEVFFSTVTGWREPLRSSFFSGFFGKKDERLILASENKEKNVNTFQMHCFTLDFQQKLVLNIVRHYLKNIQCL